MINIVSTGSPSRIFECFNPETNDFIGIIGDIETSEYSLIKDNVKKMVTECLMKHKVTPTAITNTLEYISDKVRSNKISSFGFPTLDFNSQYVVLLLEKRLFRGIMITLKVTAWINILNPTENFLILEYQEYVLSA